MFSVGHSRDAILLLLLPSAFVLFFLLLFSFPMTITPFLLLLFLAIILVSTAMLFPSFLLVGLVTLPTLFSALLS